MNPQGIFNRVADHLMTQREQSSGTVGDSKVCLYRGPRGLKCAVGCLIKDEFYRPSMNAHGVRVSVVVRALEDSLGESLSSDDLAFLADLQDIHDGTAPEGWPVELIKFAQRHDLDLPQCLIPPEVSLG